MEVEGNRTTRNTSKPAQTADGTDMGQTYRQTYRQTDIQTDIFFIAVLGLWEAKKHTKKILARSEKITDGSRYSII